MGRARIIADLVGFSTDSGVLNFGADKEITLTHDPDDGLILKHAATADDSFPELTFQTGDTDIAVNDLLGRINFQAPDEGAGTDAILVAGAIAAISEGDFSSSANATSLIFQTGASETATTKMTLSSGGNLDVTGVISGAGFTAGSAVLAEAELELLDGLTAGTAIASKVVTTDANIDSTGMRNLTISGEIDAATGDFSGVVDVAGATTTAAITASGIIKTDDTTAATSTTDGSLQTDGGLSVAADAVIGDDLLLLSDAAVLNFGADSEIKLTHVHNTGLLLTDSGGTPTLQFHDANESISSDGGHLIFTSNGVAFDFPSADGSDGQVLKTDGSGVLSFVTASANTPSSADGQALGSASLEWSDLFLADAGTIQFGNDQDVILTHVADTGLLLSGTNVIQFNDASQNIGAPSNAILDINATDEIELNATLCDVNANLDVSGTIVGASTLSATTITASTAFVPDASDGAALGTTSLEFSDLFLADGAVINLGADQDVKITHVADTGVLLNAASVIQFRDSAINIGSPADGDLDINADDEIELNSTLVDLNGNLDVSGTIVGASTLSATTGTFSGVLKTDDTTNATSTTDGSLQTDGGLSVALDAVIGDDLFLLSDSAVLNIGADSDLKITHDGTNGDFESAGNLVFDVAGDITLDAAGLDVNFAAAGTNFGLIAKSSDDLIFRNPISDGSIFIQGSDGGSNQTYIEIDPSSLEGLYAFHGNGTAGNPLGMTNYNDVNGTTLSFNTSASGKETQTFRLNGTQVGSIVITSSTAYNTSSDYRLKQNVEYDWDATTECKKLKPCQFKWINDVEIEDGGGATARTITGFLAHELQTIVPEAASGVKDATETYINDDGDSATRIKPQGIDQSKIIAILTKTIQELEARITALES